MLGLCALFNVNYTDIEDKKIEIMKNKKLIGRSRESNTGICIAVDLHTFCLCSALSLTLSILSKSMMGVSAEPCSHVCLL